MIKTIIFSFTLMMGTFFTNAQTVDVPQSQIPVIVKVTATWCPTCGGWGWNFFENLYEDNREKAVVFADHYSGNYQNSTAQAIASNFNSVGQPVFFLNGNDENVTSSNQTNKRSYFANQVNQITQNSPDVQTGIEASYSGNNLKIKYSTKFFNTLSGEYYLGIYPIEKSVIGYQASRGQNADHRNVLRDELTGNPFGNLIASGEITSNSIFDGSLEMDLNGYNPDNLEIATIIWKKEGNKYKVINSNIDRTVEKNILSGLYESKTDKYAIDIFPTIFKLQNSIISINTGKSVENVKIEVFNTQGKKIYIKTIDKLSKGITKFSLNMKSYSKGNYFVKISNKDGILKTAKIIFL